MASQASAGELTGTVAAPVVQAHTEMLSDTSIQFDLTGYVAEPMPAWLEPLARALQAAGPYMIYVFWGVVIVVGALILFVVIREMTGVAWRFPWQRAKPVDDEADEWRPEAVVARTLLAEADRLAEAGRYNDAVHLLLQRSVEDIAIRLPNFVQPSLTARDIAHAAAVPDSARTAFARIAAVVEAGLFARRPVSADGWQTARSAYEQFAFKGAWA